MKYDAVIIGAGVSGLTATLTLAQKGRKVAILEKDRQIAPLIRRFKRGNVWCAPGFHYSGGFEDSGALSVLFRYLGMRHLIRSVPMNNEVYDMLCFGDRQIPFPVGLNEVKKALCRHFPGSKKAVDKYIEDMRAIMDSTPFISFDMEFGEFSRNKYTDLTLNDYLDGEGAEDDLKELLGQYGEFLYGTPGGEVSFFAHAITMGTFYESPQTLEQGGDEIVAAFEQRLNEEGVDIFCERPVISLKVDDKRRLQGVVIADDELLETNNCVSTLHPALLPNILPKGAVRPAYLSRLKDLENTFSTFALYIELEAIPEKIAHTNLYRMLPGEKGLKPDSALVVMSCDPKNYGNKKKALCVLVGNSEVTVSKEDYKDRKKTNVYYDYKERKTKETVEQLLKFFPEIEGKFKVVDSATPFTFERYTGTINGSMYGVKHSVNQINPDPVTSIFGFYLAGQSILMPGIMGAAISGFLGASKILGLEGLWKDLQGYR